MNDERRLEGANMWSPRPDGKPGLPARRAFGALGVALLASVASPALAQEVRCPVTEPARAAARESDDATPATGSTAASRLRHRDPLVREMARADVLYAEGRRDEAEVIYRRLAETPADRRQTARRAKLKLAQAAIRRADFPLAERYVAEATGPGALPDLRARGRRLTAQIAERRGILQAEAALDAIDPLVAERRFDEAVVAAQRLLQHPCPHPADYNARVKIRLAQIHRARGDFAAADAAARDALASATTDRVRERAGTAIAEIATAARVAQLRGTADQANAQLAAGNAAGAVALLEPLLASQPPLPRDLDTDVRLRLARAYGQLGQHDRATATVEPLLAYGVAPEGVPAEGAAGALSPAQYDTLARVYLARAGDLQERGDYAQAEGAYQQVLGWTPPPSPEVRGTARLGLARVLGRRGNREGALEQIALARQDDPSPTLIERADRLLVSLDEGVPLNRLVGYVQAGLAYDSNAPTLVSAIRDEDDDVGFPTDRKFDDWHARFDARLQYRAALNDGGDYFDIVATGTRTLQFDLPELDRTRLGVRAGPVLALGEATELRFGALFDIDWRGDNFRSSEPGAFVGIDHDLTEMLALSTVYTLVWHNDYQDERDGWHHEFETQLRADLSEQDVLTFNGRLKREEGKLDRVENVRLLGGTAYRHRWDLDGSVRPFVEVGGEAERVWYDGRETNGERRRDWKYNVEAAGGADIGRNWRVRLHYSYFDIESNQDARDRIANHQAGITVRYTWR